MSVREVASRSLWRASGASWRFPALIGAVVLTMTALPYLVGSGFAGNGRLFMGIAYDVPDTAQYFAWMRAFAHSNSLLIANPLTSEPNHAVFFNLLWFSLGHLGQLLHAQPAVIYQGFRWLAGGGFLAALWVICGQFCAPEWERRLAWLLATLGGGFGWLWVILKYTLHHQIPPLDIYIAEPNTLFALIGFPHLLFASSLLIGIFLLALRGYERSSWVAYSGAAALGLLLGVTHAYDLLIVYTVLCVFVVAVMVKRRAIPWRLVAGVAIIGAVSSPPAFYFTYLTQRDATWRGVLAQYGNGEIWTPSPPHLLILLGPVFLVALIAVLVPAGRRALWHGPERDLLVTIWFLASFVLVYLPTSYQIKMLNGWQIPAAILAARGLVRLLPPLAPQAGGAIRRVDGRWPLAVIAGLGLVALALPTNLYLVAWRGDELHRAAPPYSLTTNDVEALRWLDTNARDGDVVLASLTVGQYVPGMSDARPVLAHWAQTLNYYEKDEAVRRFYAAGTTEDERLTLLRTWNVLYVFVGPEERALGAFDPHRQPARYAPVFASGETTIYAVQLTDAERGA
jgi:hypothetical protein